MHRAPDFATRASSCRHSAPQRARGLHRRARCLRPRDREVSARRGADPRRRLRRRRPLPNPLRPGHARGNQRGWLLPGQARGRAEDPSRRLSAAQPRRSTFCGGATLRTSLRWQRVAMDASRPGRNFRSRRLERKLRAARRTPLMLSDLAAAKISVWPGSGLQAMAEAIDPAEVRWWPAQRARPRNRRLNEGAHLRARVGDGEPVVVIPDWEGDPPITVSTERVCR